MSVKKLIIELSYILIGNFILAVGVGLFLLPNDILSGGIAGVAILFKPFVSFIDSSTMVMILSIVLLFIGTIFLGKKFFLTTVLSSLIYPLFLMFVESYFTIPNIDPLLSSIYGGLLGGAGVGMVVRQGASTGGMDIPPLIANKFFHIEVSKAVMVTDGLTVLFGLYIYGLEAVLIGLISVFSTTFAISKIMTIGGIQAKSVQIISAQYEKINEIILKDLNRGTTIIESSGGYTNNPNKMLLVVISNKEYGHLIDAVESVDSNAFVIVSDVTEVKGYGFSEIVRI